jgi:hypothetical protein
MCLSDDWDHADILPNPPRLDSLSALVRPELSLWSIDRSNREIEQ